MPLSLSRLGFWFKTLDPSRFKLLFSNPTLETWSSKQDLRFHHLILGKSEISSFSRFGVKSWKLELIFQISLGFEHIWVF